MNIIKNINKFKSLKKWEDKYKYLIELGSKLPNLEKKNKIKINLVEGCQSRIWVNICVDKITNKIYIQADSEALIPKGILYLIIQHYSNQDVQYIIKNNNNFIKEIGFEYFLSPIRTNGINLIIKKIKLFAIMYQTIQHKNIDKQNVYC
jgi:cysteine desulfuration protein SufE